MLLTRAISALLLLLACTADIQPAGAETPPARTHDALPAFEHARDAARPRYMGPLLYAQTPLRRGMFHAARGKGTKGDGAGVPPAEGCSSGDPWPGYANFCPDDVEAQILAETGVTVVAPTPPTLPSGTVTVYSGTAADSIAEVRTAIVSDSGLAHVILGGNLTGGALRLHSGGVGAQDAVIDGGGIYTIDNVWFGDEAAGGDAARIVFLNVKIGAILGWKGGGGTGINRADDIIFHGCEFTGELGIQEDVGCDRWSFTGTIGAGDDGTGGGAIGTFASCNDLFIGNSSWEGGEGSTGDHNDWPIRWGQNANHIWLVDSIMRGWFKPIIRGDGGEIVMYTTDACVGFACAFMQANTYNGNMIHAVDGDGNGIAINQMLMYRGRWVMGNDGSVGNLWGPETSTDRANFAGNSYCATNSGIFEEADLTAKEAGQGGDDWDLNETYDGIGNTFDYEATVEDCFTNFGGWVTRVAEEIPDFPVSGSDIGTVGADPDDI